MYTAKKRFKDMKKSLHFKKYKSKYMLCRKRFDDFELLFTGEHVSRFNASFTREHVSRFNRRFTILLRCCCLRLAHLGGRAWARGGSEGAGVWFAMCHPWASSQAWPLCWGRDRPSRLPRATFCAPPLPASRARSGRAAAPPSPTRSPRPGLGFSAQAAEARGAATGARPSLRSGQFPFPAGAAAAPSLALVKLRAPRAPGPALPSLGVPARALPAHQALAPCCCDVCTPGDHVSPSDGGGSRGAQVFWGPGRCEGGGAGRRHRASGRDSKLL